jgi:putative hydrolases of HD superfamily
MKVSSPKNAVDFLFEIGNLRHIRRSGWWHCKIDDPETVSDHSFRTAIIAKLLAKMENFKDGDKIAFAALIHDISESRLLDLHKISAKYVKNKAEIEQAIIFDQKALLGIDIFPNLTLDEKILVKDADLLEMALTAKEYASIGHKDALHLFNEAGKNLKLKSSKHLFSALKSAKPSDWWLSMSKK